MATKDLLLLGLKASAALALLASSTAARADDSAGAEPTSADPASEHEASTRRSGLIIGLETNIGLGLVAGYPLDLKKLGRAAYYTETGIGPRGTGFFWVGAALKDWLSFGLGGTLDGLVIGDVRGWGYGGVFRLEAFPLWPLGGVGKEIGATFDAGTTAIMINHKDDPDRLIIDGGAASYVGGGVFYEGLRTWHLSAGPGIYAGYMWSDTVRYGSVSLALRLTFYSGAPIPDKKPAQ